MRLLLDQDIYHKTAQFLISCGHNVLKAADFAMQTAIDEDLLKKAFAEGRIFITRDRDYGNLVFVKGIKVGVLYLRMRATTVDEVHIELERVLSLYDESELTQAFVVVESGRHRFRRL